MVDQTPSLKAVITELEKRAGDLPGSHTPQVIRPIIDGGKERPDLGYSQHSYRNASDIMVNGWAKQQPIVSVLQQMKAEGYPVGTILHANNDGDHGDHIHVEGDPKVTGDPRKPETWNIAGAKPAPVPVGTGEDTTRFEDDTPLWLRILAPITNITGNPFTGDPVEDALQDEVDSAMDQLLYRIGFGVVALILGSVTLFLLMKAFTEEGLGIDVAALASKGVVTSK